MSSELKVLFPHEGESWAAFARRVKSEKGSLLLVLSGPDAVLARLEEERAVFVEAMAKVSGRVRIATKERRIVRDARKKGVRVVEKVADLKNILDGHPFYEEAIRTFSPAVWQQRLRNNLQTMGLLSLPKLRVWTLIVVSFLLFFFVLFRLLPSAEIEVVPREDTITHTANIFLVMSGATVDIPQRVRILELMPIRIQVEKTMTFDQISKEFIGDSARVAMTVHNESQEEYGLREGTRVMNQAGMVFRIVDPIRVAAGDEIIVRAEADDLDLYGEIIGERGNVPADLRWDFPGLAPEEQKLIYATNESPARGGVTRYRTVLHQGDLDVAQAMLEQELLAEAKQLVDEHRMVYNNERDDQMMEILYYDELTKIEYKNFQLPDQFIGEAVTSVPITGSIEYIAYAYDTQAVLNLLKAELLTHVEDGKRLLPSTITMDRLIAHVIDYNDDLTWIKLTVDLSGTEQFILDPLSSHGARFGKKVREMIGGKKTDVAERIMKNLPEVEDVSINIWPPWNRQLPSIPSHISITVDAS